MIRPVVSKPGSRRSPWRRVFIPFAILNLEGEGRSVVICELLETRRSVSLNRRLWRSM